MIPEVIAKEIIKRWGSVYIKMVHSKRLDPTVYQEVVSSLAHLDSPGVNPKGLSAESTDRNSLDGKEA